MKALADRVLAGERPAVAEALNRVEDTRAAERARAADLMAELRAKGAAKLAHTIGITGPPGVGKSTLAGALVRKLRADGRSVGMLAVDPSSVRSGGAVLGDRARVAFDPSDEHVFFRSLASKGQTGGLVDAALSAVGVLAAAYDIVLVETTGVGQTETDVRDVADTVVLVIQPGSGDTLQFIKAGIMEIPDLIVVNKADEERLAKQAQADVKQALAAEARAEARDVAPEVLSVSALHRRGIDELIALLDKRAAERDPEALSRARRDGSAHWIARSYRRRHGEAGLERIGGESALHARVAAALDGGTAPERVALDLDQPA
ncbi:MAG: hypothetical protein KC417_00285 [Myxococcales bacterium]|nr:hypothetical protein [Myxococcales bacterium]